MANYDIDHVSVLGLDNGVRTYTATIGLALFQTIFENGPSGLVDPLVAAVPAGFVITHHAHSGTCTRTVLPGSATDWETINTTHDMNRKVRVDIRDPAGTASDPIATIRTWAVALGGTIDVSGGL